MFRSNWWCVFACLLFAGMLSDAWGDRVSIQYDANDPMQVFGVGDLTAALTSTGNEIVSEQADFHIAFSQYQPGMGPQSFRIQKEGTRGIRIFHGDSVGAMYGALELAEDIALGNGMQGIREKARKPYVPHRGLKFNIPLDARAPSYDDTGTSAHQNIPVMWEWEFWKSFIDQMIRNRYDTLTLWVTHPYPGMVRLPEYPDANYDDVRVLAKPVDEHGDRHWDRLDVFDPANTKVVKKITLDEKIAFWTRVFDYAQAHGITIHLYHWNIYTFGAEGKYGITDSGKNEATVRYMRYCVRRMLETYPQIDGIGVAAGEHFDLPQGGAREEWLWKTYALGIKDYCRDHPDRRITFIFRSLMSNADNIMDVFADYDVGAFHTDHKYARARVHSTTTSPYLDIEYRDGLEKFEIPCWLNVRNDDLFIFRWGDPDYVREFWANIPRDVLRSEAGYFMGPDGFVQGKEFVIKNDELTGQMEVDKHWYRFMMFGRLSYDLTLTRDYFEKRLAKHFPETDPECLYETWQSASQIIPLVNRFFFRVNDLQFSPEGCIAKEGFLTVDRSFFAHPPLQGSGILSVQQYAQKIIQNESFDGITPIDVADTLDANSAQTLAGLKTLRSTAKQSSPELLSTLTDLEAMAWLGKYYAAKIRGAAELAVYRADRTRTDHHDRAVQHFETAVQQWTRYADVATSQYRPQLFSRTHYMDWSRILDDVRQELESVRAEAK
ncbi:hypothetical protein [Crateriforma conspicua]|uniref:Beta-hexosaminidase bacterial type N-terminal domain-containing protein n=1 Tax=Crateriforma conspicua TaxID=2527996 RepID=A0A5C6FIF4_9PLAN|nr:hypothetical protein [Crateriforma conspicua]TWU62045.1 hypothetical protein V7x_37740 [Crateriforma conspicua]